MSVKDLRGVFSTIRSRCYRTFLESLFQSECNTFHAIVGASTAGNRQKRSNKIASYTVTGPVLQGSPVSIKCLPLPHIQLANWSLISSSSFFAVFPVDALLFLFTIEFYTLFSLASHTARSFSNVPSTNRCSCSDVCAGKERDLWGESFVSSSASTGPL